MIPMPLPCLSMTSPRSVGCSMAGGLTHPRPSFAMRETDFNHRQSRGGVEHGVYLDRALELAMRHRCGDRPMTSTSILRGTACYPIPLSRWSTTRGSTTPPWMASP